MIKSILIFFVGCVFSILAPKIVKADTEIIRPDADGHFTEFTGRSGCTYDYECVDEESADDDGTYIYGNTINMRSTSFYSDATFTSIDSIKITARARKTGFINASNGWAIGYGYIFSEPPAIWVGIKTNITLGTTYTTVTTDAITVDENSVPWTISSLANHSFGVKLTVNLGADIMRYTWGYVTVYGTSPSVEVVGGGLIQDENRAGLIEGGIAR